MSLTTHKKKFERSSLPSEAQLGLHVDANDFMSKVNQPDFSETLLEDLAKYLHEEVYGKIIYPPKPGETNDRYEDLDDHKKELNRKFIKDILNKLDKCNSLVVAGRGIHETFKFTEDEIEQLARTEHEGWLNEKVENDFRYAPNPKEAKKQNPDIKFNASMLFWDELNAEDFEKQPEKVKKAVGREELPKNIKEDNRKLIRSIPDILASIGYTIVRK